MRWALLAAALFAQSAAASQDWKAPCRQAPESWVKANDFLAPHDRWMAVLYAWNEFGQPHRIAVMVNEGKIDYDFRLSAKGDDFVSSVQSGGRHCPAGFDQAAACLGLPLDLATVKSLLFMDVAGACLTGPSGLDPMTAIRPGDVRIDYLDWMPGDIRMPKTVRVIGKDARKQLRMDLIHFQAHLPEEHHLPWPDPAELSNMDRW